MSYKNLSIFLLASTALAVPAFAQDNAIVALDAIMVEADEAQALLGNGQLTAEQIEARNPASIKDIFTAESAINSSGGAAIAQKVFVNGLEESLLSVTVDGARQNKSAFHHSGNMLIDPALLKSVEVSSGLAPADAGSGAMAGSIAYETKDARDLLEDGDTSGGLLSLKGGTNGQGTRGTLTTFGELGAMDYVLSGTLHNGSDYEDGDGATVLGTEPSLSSYLAKLSYTADNGDVFKFTASQTTDDGLRAAQAGRGTYFIRPDFAGLVSGETVLMQGLSQRESYIFSYSKDAANGWFAPTIQLSYNEQMSDVIALTGENKSFTGFVSNDFTLANGVLSTGVDFFSETAEGYENDIDDGSQTFLGKEKNSGVGLYAQARQNLSTRVSASYGARVDHQSFTGADGSEFSDTGVSLNGALDVMLTDALSLTAGVASSWGGYDLGEAALINYSSTWEYTGFEASKAESARIGLRYNTGGWHASGAIFQTTAYDLASILPDTDRAATSDVRTRGFDGSLGYDWGNGFARMNYTYADVTKDGEAISATDYYYGRPMGHIIGLEASWDVNDQFSLGGVAQIALENDDVAEGETTQAAYEVVNVYAEYQPAAFENLNLRLDVNNLFDETYVTRGADVSSRAIDLTDPGRSISLTASLKF